MQSHESSDARALKISRKKSFFSSTILECSFLRSKLANWLGNFMTNLIPGLIQGLNRLDELYFSMQWLSDKLKLEIAKDFKTWKWRFWHFRNCSIDKFLINVTLSDPGQVYKLKKLDFLMSWHAVKLKPEIAKDLKTWTWRF